MTESDPPEMPKYPQLRAPHLFTTEEMQEALREKCDFTVHEDDVEAEIKDDLVDATVMSVAASEALENFSTAVEEFSCTLSVGGDSDPSPTDNPEEFVEMRGVE